MTTAIVLAGGFGTRLASVVPHLPKALAPIQSTPFLHILLQQLDRSGVVSKVILALGYKAVDIQSFISNQDYSFPIEYSIESTPLGTGGALLQALAKAESDPLIAMNGDSFFDLDFSDFLHFHRSKNALFTMACREIEDCSRFGAIEIGPDLRIRSFSEKSAIPRKGWINAGIYCLQKDLFSSYPAEPYSLEKDFFPTLIKRDCFAFAHNGKFIDIGTANSYSEAQEILKPWITL